MSPALHRLLRSLAAAFGIDPRSLALFRIAVALIILADLAIRAGDLQAMYTDSGMFPRQHMSGLITTAWNWSLHSLSGAWEFQAVLMGIAALFATALLAGWHTRIATIGSWVLLISIHHRVPVIISGAEILLRMLLFWGTFLPLGQAWSLDARRYADDVSRKREPVVSVASIAILLQMAVMYLFSAIFKTNDQWFSGRVLEGVLRHDFYAARAGAALLEYPELLRWLTWAVLALEWVGPLLIFAHRSWLRITAIAALAAMHTGVAVCLHVGLFSWVAIAGLLLFLPGSLWGRGKAGPVCTPAGSLLRQPAQGICMVFLIYVLLVNVNSLRSRPLAFLSPEKWTAPARGLGLSQSWGMFDEVPSKDGWQVAGAKLRDGTGVDLLRGGAPFTTERPPFPAEVYPNHYWHKLFRELAYADAMGFQYFREPVCRYLCREWDARHPAEQQVAGFDLIYLMEIPGSPRQGEHLLHLDFPVGSNAR